MSRRRSRPARLPPTTIPTCCFCGFSEDDEVEYGKLWNHDGIVTHYYCLLLSSNMEQNGNDNEGILGFMPADIQKELRRGKRHSCHYCKRAGATLGCCNSRCKRVFHLPCGLRAGSLHQFFGEFRSFCITHRMKQEIDEHITAEAAAASTVTCYICYEEVNPQNTIRTLWAPCCRKNAWFHRKCVQRLALSAGYFFKCPLCNNKQEFQQAMLEHGIFIPNQDASWELVPNAYQELLHRHNRCDAVECLCPKGRSHTGVNAKWELVLCRLCGSQGVHKACGHLKLTSSVWECAECVGMLRKTNEATPRVTDGVTETTNDTSDDESSSDSDISVGRNPSPLLETDRPNTPSPVSSPIIKLRPGPRSFKLQQAALNAKSAESTKAEPANTFVPEKRDIILPDIPNTNGDIISNGNKSNDEASQVKNSPNQKVSISLDQNKPEHIETKSTVSPDTGNAKSIEPKRRDAEVIVIDSDDEVEIISVKPKQNVLTTIDGTQIPIHSLIQVSREPQKAEGDVKVAKSIQSQVSKQSNNVSPATKNNNIVLGTSSSSIPLGLKSTPSPLSPSKLSKFQVTSGNAKSPEFIVGNQVPQQSPVMTFKITNVTSLRQEEFTNTFPHPDVITRIHIPGGCVSDLSLNDDQQVGITQITSPKNTSNTPKSRTTAFQLSTAAIKDINMKRKSEEYADKNSSDLLIRAVSENRKRARTCDFESSESLQKNISIPWSIKFSDVNGVIPMLATSIPLTCSTNNNRFVQSTATIQSKLTDKGGVTTIYNSDIQKKNGSQKFPPRNGFASSVRNKIMNNTSHVDLHNNSPSSGGSLENSFHLSKVTKTYGSNQPQIAKRIPTKNVVSNNSNVIGTPQFTVNSSKLLPDNSSRLFKPHTLTQQQIPNSGESLTITSNSVYQSRTEMKRYSESGGNYQKNISTTEVSSSYNGLPRNCTETLTSSNGNHTSVFNNAVSKSNHSITQLANGMPITSGCDGDAGSSPAVEAGFADQTTSRRTVYASTEPVPTTDADERSAVGQVADDHSSISNGISAYRTNVQHYSSVTTAGKYCDKHRMIPENVPLQNLKFRVMDPTIIQIVVDDNYTINVSTKTVNRENYPDKTAPRSSIEEQKQLHSFLQQGNSMSSKLLGEIEEELSINIDREHDLPKNRKHSETTLTQNELTSVTESPKNPIVSKIKFNNDESSDQVAIVDSKFKRSHVSETKCNNESKISDSNMNGESLASDERYCRIHKMNSIRETFKDGESLICASLEGNNRNSLSVQYKENVSNEVDTIFPPLNKNKCINLRNLCERDDNIISVDNSKGLSVNVKKNTVKKLRYNNNVRILSSVDFCSKIHNCLNDKEDKKLCVSSLVKSLDDSSEFNRSIDCYNNFRNIVDRSSVSFDCNIKDFDANVRKSLINNDRDVTDLCAVNEILNKTSVNSDLAKCNITLHTTNSNGFNTPFVDKNSMINNCHALFSFGNINSNIYQQKAIHNAVKDNDTNSIVDRNVTSKTYESRFGIKVKIDLNKIQHFIDSRPQLFDKSKYRKIQVLHNHVSKISRVSLASRHSHNSDSKTQTDQSLENTVHSRARKKLKYSSELLEKDSKS